MNKTITITLGGVIFHIEEDAYQKLNEYLEGVRSRLFSNADIDEIMSDIESGIAEKFSNIVGPAKQAINIIDVGELISVMGKVEDFNENEEKDNTQLSNSSASNISSKPKKLYRDPDDVIIAGVCSGLAAYFGIDPAITRIIFAVSIFFGGTGIIAYILLWLIVPLAQTNIQKLEMQGEPITLAGIEQAVQKNVERIKMNKNGKNGNIFEKIIRLPFLILKLAVNIIKKIFSLIIPIIRIILAIMIIITVLTGIISLTVASAIITVNPQSPYIISDIPLSEIAGLMPFRSAMISLYFVAAIPLFFLLLIGVALARKKNIISLAALGVLAGLWIAALTVFSAIGFRYAPGIQEKISSENSRPQITKSLDLNDFDSITADDHFDIYVRPADKYSVQIEGRENDIKRARIEVSDKRLRLISSSRTGLCLLCLTRKPLKVKLTMPDLKEYNSYGTSKLDLAGFQANYLKLDLNGSSIAGVDGHYDKLAIGEDGTSRLFLTGTSTGLTLRLDGASHLIAKDWQTDTAYLRIYGTSRVDITGTTTEQIVELYGASRLDAYDFHSMTSNLTMDGSSQAGLSSYTLIKADLDEAAKLYYSIPDKAKKEISIKGAAEAIAVTDRKDMEKYDDFEK